MAAGIRVSVVNLPFAGSDFARRVGCRRHHTGHRARKKEHALSGRECHLNLPLGFAARKQTRGRIA
jgi:hypothetical protein